VNLSHEPGVDLALQSSDGTVQAQQQFSATQRNWVADLNLSPGNFTLDGLNSEHHCKIVIQ
jgi:hypothetical protein